MSPHPPLVEPGPELTHDEIERYSRHLTLAQVGTTGQRRLKNARVLVVGAGGLGSPALQYLAAAGVGTIGIVDDDVVDVSNIQRQVVHGTGDVGRSKVDSAAAAIERINPGVTVRTHPVRLGADNAEDLVGRYDLVLDGADNFATRYVVSDACVLARVPCVWGSILRFDGRVSVFWTGRGPTYRDLHPDPPEPGEVPSCAEGGVLGVLPAAVGAVMATEAIKVITGIGEPLVGRVLVHDALAMTWRELALVADPDASPVRDVAAPPTATACGPTPDTPAAHERIGAAELIDLLEHADGTATPFVLVDVREDWERQLITIPGAVRADLDDLLARGVGALPEQARGRDLVVHCASGVRSARVLAALRPHYVDREESVRHLEGGVSAWTRERSRRASPLPPRPG